MCFFSHNYAVSPSHPGLCRKNLSRELSTASPLIRFSLSCYAFRMLRNSPAFGLSILAGLQLLTSPALARDSQVLETLFRSEDELNHQILSLQKSYVILSKSLKQQAAAARNQNYTHFDKKYARQEILKQIWLLQRELKLLDESSDVLAKDTQEGQEDMYKTQQNLEAVATQLDQTQRALMEVKSAIRQTLEAEKEQR
jgi:hypothetical protein